MGGCSYCCPAHFNQTATVVRQLMEQPANIPHELCTKGTGCHRPRKESSLVFMCDARRMETFGTKHPMNVDYEELQDNFQPEPIRSFLGEAKLSVDVRKYGFGVSTSCWHCPIKLLKLKEVAGIQGRIRRATLPRQEEGGVKERRETELRCCPARRRSAPKH